jgi:hypothetical protein
VKIPPVKITLEAHGTTRLTIESADDGWHLTGEGLRGEKSVILDPDGHRAMAELVRHFGMWESQIALIRALDKHDREVSKKSDLLAQAAEHDRERGTQK